jgi:hypothetical protein
MDVGRDCGWISELLLKEKGIKAETSIESCPH